jgi:hypothetical protein
MHNVPNIAQSVSVKTRYVPIVRAIYDHIREQHVAQSKTPSARPLFSQAPGFPPPFNPTQYGPFVPAFNPEGAPFPSYPFGPQLTTPRWLQYEPGLNMVNWNEVHSGSVNPIDDWEARINGDSGALTYLQRAISDIFPQKNTEMSPGLATVYVNRVSSVDPASGVYELIMNHGNSGTTALPINLLGSTGVVEVTDQILAEASEIFTCLENLSTVTGPSYYMAVDIGNYGQIKNIEVRQSTSFSISPNPL